MEIKEIDEDSESVPYHIRPEDIDANKPFLSAFGKGEVEIAANYVVRFCQKLGGWKAFTRESLEKFYEEVGGAKNLTLHGFGKKTFPFYWLNEKLLLQRPDGKCCVTDLFIERCFASSPKRKNP